MPNTYKQTILNSFAAIDIESLQSHLKKDRTYQETTAEIFLREIREIFRKHKILGDTEMIPYKGKCKQKGSLNFGKKGYRFVGNLSRNFIDLIFVVAEDDILDIYACNFFEPNKKISNLGYRNNPIVAEDEKTCFVVTPGYLVKLNATREAWDEIICTPTRKIIFKDLKNWVDKYSTTNLIIGSYRVSEPWMKWTPFLMLYADLKGISVYISMNYAEIIEATSQIERLTNEQQIIEWLVDHEELGNKAPFLLKCNFKNPIHFSGKVFRETLHFLEFFDQYYTEIFQKYTTYTNEEVSNLYKNYTTKEETKILKSLKFHLQNRKALEEEGISVPLYINLNLERN